MKFLFSPQTQQVSNGIIICVEEEGGEVVVSVWGALEVLEVPRAAFSRAIFHQGSGTWSAGHEPWEAIRAARGQE